MNTILIAGAALKRNSTSQGRSTRHAINNIYISQRGEASEVLSKQLARRGAVNGHCE